jgi:hypothetical protein
MVRTYRGSWQAASRRLASKMPISRAPFWVAFADCVLMTSSLEVRRWMRARKLASDDRAGSWARAEGRRRQYAFLRIKWRFVATTVLVAAAAIVGATFLTPNSFAKGMVVGAGVVATFGGIAVLALLVTGTAQTGMGEVAEQWTATELRPLRKVGGRVINNLALQRWDIDHVVILPSGVFAIESKWSGRGWDLDHPDDQLTKAIRRASGNARTLRLWKPIKGTGVPEVQPVLFLWGGTELTKPTRPRRMDGVDVVYGIEAAKVWRSVIGEPGADNAIEPEAIEKLWLAISSHIDDRDAHDAAHSPPPPTLTQLYWKALITAGMAVGAILLCLKAFLLIHPWPLFALVAASAIAAGVVARRFATTRIAGLAWALGVTSGLALIAFAGLLQRIS